ncbi:hypothetical protein F4782DRAFT_532476 [Xylaria castorea]|nr:hypothetical protein F4782DRAFT_532476 [Xylaria castorea]
MASVIITKDRYALADMLTTSRYQPHTTYGGLAKATLLNRSPSPNSKEKFQRLHAACEMLSDLAKSRQSVVSIVIQPKAPPTERQEYDRTKAWIASRQVDTFSRRQELEELKAQWLGQERDMFETERKMRRLKADIVRLQVEDAIEGHEIPNQTNNKWRGKVFSFVLGTTSQRAKDAMAKRHRDLNRNHSIKIKREQMLMGTNRLSALETAIQTTERAIEELDQEI